mgnify:CR=1 FL=1
MQVSFQVLSETEREQIHTASLEVLSSVGMKIETEQMREALAKRGASVDEAAETVK